MLSLRRISRNRLEIPRSFFVKVVIDIRSETDGSIYTTLATILHSQ